MKRIDKIAMAKGYDEMAEINLGIAEYCFYAEDEGERLSYGKMDREKGEGKAE